MNSSETADFQIKTRSAEEKSTLILMAGEECSQSASVRHLADVLSFSGAEIEFSSGASGTGIRAWMDRIRRNEVLCFAHLSVPHPHFRRQLLLAQTFSCAVVRIWLGEDVNSCLGSSEASHSARVLDKGVDLNIAFVPCHVESLSSIGIRVLYFPPISSPDFTGKTSACSLCEMEEGASLPEILATLSKEKKNLKRLIALSRAVQCQAGLTADALILDKMRIAFLLVRKAPGYLKRFRFSHRVEKLLTPFYDEGSPPAEAYEDLFRYFLTGWEIYREPLGAGACYPGLPSWSGEQVDRIEGFARIMPLFGAWCASGRESQVVLSGGTLLSLPREFERGLVAGTDPGSPAYWGNMPGKSNQRIVEAADIALALWLFRNSVWSGLSERQREPVVAWLSQIEGRPGLDNNWHLFFVLIERVLDSLGYPGLVSDSRERFERIKEFHLGDGWFRDGPNGETDFYNAWGFHYALTWINRIDPEWDPHFIQDCQRKFLASYKYLIGPAGLPILGRSLHYRIAAPAPLVAGHEDHPDVVPVSQARRSLDAVWGYFIRRGAVRYGTVSQGYFGPDYRIVDPYAGPASSLWSLRSLIMAFYFPSDHAFWSSEGGKLPVESGDFTVNFEGPRWQVCGKSGAEVITVEKMNNSPDAAPKLKPFGRIQMLREWALGKPRPKNQEARYGRRFYRSDMPFWNE